ncbi:MAG: ABC transporter permease [Clostridia bacterium]|nr:ABC transporter permease [Clostridia bacterium]
MYKHRGFALPFIIMIIIGTLVPLCSIVFYGFTDDTGNFTIENFLAMFSEEHIKALIFSVLLALISTFICLILAYPLGLILRKSKLGKSGFVIFIFVLPMWMNFLLRTMAWQVILERNGLLDHFCQFLNIPFVEIINTPFAVVLGMVYDFLPFMILPIYNVLKSMDEGLIEASYDLGAGKFTTLRKVILPLSVPGIISGITMVFVPSLTTFVISNMLGGGKINLIGNIIEQEFTVSANWNLGSGLSFVMMILIVVSMVIFTKLDEDGEVNLL